jgi:uncharacterized protein with NRDE domain
MLYMDFAAWLLCMCLIAVALNAHARFPFLLIANRDEFRQRPTEPLHAWASPKGIVAGRDQRGGGTWLSASPRGRVAAVTNVRDPSLHRDGPSRGQLPLDYMLSTPTTEDWLDNLAETDQERAGYNLLAFEFSNEAIEAWWHSNARTGLRQRLGPGIHVLSNGRLNEAWPKCQRLRDAMQACLRHDSFAALESHLLEAMLDRNGADDALLPDTGVGLQMERALAPPFIDLESYGTRSTTLLCLNEQRQLHMVEYRHQEQPCEERSDHVIAV